jgi:hypothetical protein
VLAHYQRPKETVETDIELEVIAVTCGEIIGAVG